MHYRHAPSLVLWGLAMLAIALPAAASPAAYDDRFTTVEEITLELTGEHLLANDDLADIPVDELSISQQPASGTLDLGPATFNGGPLLSYTSNPGFIGYDRFRYRLDLDTGDVLEADVYIWVSPLTAPLAGDWDGDGDDDLGWFHAQRSELFLFTVRRVDSETWIPGETGCDQLDPQLKSTGWIPLAGDWDADGDDDPGFFDPVNREFNLFLLGKSFQLLPYAKVVPTIKGTRGLPIAGKWVDPFPDSVGLYYPNQERIVLFSHTRPVGIVADFTFPAGPGGWWPAAGDWNADGTTSTALWDPVARVLLARNANSSGRAQISVAYEPQQSTARLPLGGDWSVSDSIAFYQQDPPTRFILYPYDLIGVIGGSAIVLPPPEDPVIAVCSDP